MQMSGDLGNAGQIETLLGLVEPRFDTHQHGLLVGNNLIKANLTLGRIDRAEQILNSLFTENRMDWKETLSFWDTEIAKAKTANSSITPNSLSAGIYAFDGPIWLKTTSPAFEIFQLQYSESPAIAFLGSSAETSRNPDNIEVQLADTPGRLSRGLPLFLAEQVTFACRLRALTLIPWVTRKDAHGGFLLGGGPWTDKEAATHASRSESRCDYIVTTHLKSTEGSWCVQLRLVRTSDAECLGTLSTSLNFSQPQDTIPELAGQLLQLLSTKAGVRLHTPPPLYQVPSGAGFAYYLLRLEQLLAVRCDRSEPYSSSFLHGKREILDGNIQLCVEQPRNVTVRILLANTFLAMKRIDPQILPEFKERIALLQKEMPLPEHAHNIIQSLLDEAFAG